MSRQRLGRRPSFVYRFVLRPLWRTLRVFLMAFCALGPGKYTPPPLGRTTTEQHESSERKRS